MSRDEYEKLRGRGVVKMTYEALQGAIFIEQYRNHHALQMPYKILESIMDIETALRGFRIRHASNILEVRHFSFFFRHGSAYDWL